ncbi:hypothetical protein PANT_9c00425 [Moesziomyces antarcticus T-34]|uniref:Uncharacterized protein n=1 Tax=Pseudozyma antarctica (strain T-34) TaxID=1151754 RepID=M9M1W7_PSEA3|nr:hypothetical protein PANT_9c00425 [Moesziomyces antarcticus T-34]
MLRVAALLAVLLVAVAARQLPDVVCSLPACTNLDRLRDDARGVSFHPCPGQVIAQTRLAAVDIAPDSPITQQIWDTHPTPDAYWIAQGRVLAKAFQGLRKACRSTGPNAAPRSAAASNASATSIAPCHATSAHD